MSDKSSKKATGPVKGGKKPKKTAPASKGRNASTVPSSRTDRPGRNAKLPKPTGLRAVTSKYTALARPIRTTIGFTIAATIGSVFAAYFSGWEFDSLRIGSGAIVGVYLYGLTFLRRVLSRFGNVTAIVSTIAVSVALWVGFSYSPGACGSTCTVTDHGTWAIMGFAYPALAFGWKLLFWPAYLARAVYRKLIAQEK